MPDEDASQLPSSFEEQQLYSERPQDVGASSQGAVNPQKKKEANFNHLYTGSHSFSCDPYLITIAEGEKSRQTGE